MNKEERLILRLEGKTYKIVIFKFRPTYNTIKYDNGYKVIDMTPTRKITKNFWSKEQVYRALRILGRWDPNIMYTIEPEEQNFWKEWIEKIHD